MRIGALHAIEADIRGCSAEERQRVVLAQQTARRCVEALVRIVTRRRLGKIDDCGSNPICAHALGWAYPLSRCTKALVIRNADSGYAWRGRQSASREV